MDDEMLHIVMEYAPHGTLKTALQQVMLSRQNHSSRRQFLLGATAILAYVTLMIPLSSL
jgi:excinuclease UvrABC helicase subunit UvrB